ncbi:MAG: hypothetical protein QW700_04160 [Desulfurococcaceae archaeon]
MQKRVVFLVLLVTVLASSLLPVSSTTHLCKLEAAILEIIPSSVRNVRSSTRSGKLFDPVIVEKIAIDVNAWGLESQGDGFEGYIDLTVDEKGILRLVADVNVPSGGLNPWSVIAYPEIIYGIKPWSPELRHVQEKSFKLPLNLKGLPQIYALVDYAVMNASTAVNLAFDLWILKTHEPRSPVKGDIELMIWLYKGGGRSGPHPAGKHVKTVKMPLISEGALSEAVFEVWVEREVAGGWTYVAYVLKDALERRELVLNVSSFVVDVVKMLGLDLGDYYLSSLELGFEIFYGEVINVVASIYKYYLIASSDVVDLEQLLLITRRATKLVAWIVPWGYSVDVEGFNDKFTPGIVLAYDADCGLCTSTLRAWADISFRLLEGFLHREKVVYVNLFSEKYQPSWRWRGELTKVMYDEKILRELKRIAGDGERMYIGFSEMTTCINDQECFEELVRAYEKLKELFPAARLYYYGSSGDSVKNMLKLYKEIGLDLVGLDLWSYKYAEGRVRIDDHLAEKTKQLLDVVPRDAFFVGEIGLRLNDVEAYVEPFNKHRRIVEKEGVHRAYYEQVLQHIRELGFKNGYLGVWSWNDEVYAIMSDSILQGLIINEAIALGVLPRACTALEAEGSTSIPMEEGRVLAMQALALVVAVALTLAVILLKWLGNSV